MNIRCLYDELIPIKTLKKLFHSKNRNKHPIGQIKRLAEILKYQGVRYPAKISNLSGYITSGEGRILAAELNGWDSFPVNRQDYDDSSQEYADLVADNSIASWSELDLSGINTDIGDLGPDFDIDLLGIKNFKLDPSDKNTGNGGDENNIPEVKKSFVNPGDIWQLGDHRLMCGDSTDVKSVETLMHNERAIITFTSPPYNAAAAPGGSMSHLKYNEAFNDAKTQEEYAGFLTTVTNNAKAFSDYQFINLQILSGNKIAIMDWQYRMREHFVDLMIWDKGSAFPRSQGVLTAVFECIYIFSNEHMPNRAIKTKQLGPIQNVYRGNGNTNNEHSDEHKAGFPLHFPEYFIDTFTSPGDTILDLFGGTGTTMIACEKLKRKCAIMDLDPQYAAISIERWQQYTGKKAERVHGG